ncbi:MAG: BACON domain-containing protein [bacterium]|nr:BACON domain-containing protein [bacterium]
MFKTKKNHLYATIVLIMALLAVVAAGGCNGSGGSGEKLYVMGKMHGDLANELEGICDVAAYDGVSADAPLIVSYQDGFTVSGDTVQTLRKFLDAGMSVALEHANEKEINDFLDALGFQGDFVMPSGDSYVEYYGIKILSGDIFSYVALNDDESKPVTVDDEAPDSIMSGDVLVSVDKTLPWKPIVTSGDETISFDRPPVSGDAPAEDETGRARDIVRWMNDGAAQAKAAAAGKAAEQRALNSAASGTNDLTQISRMYQKTYNASQWGNTFEITVDVYACHTYNEADKIDSDWFFIKQKGQLNPSANYINNAHYRTTTALIKNYMVEYGFDNWTVNADGKQNNKAELMDSKPNTSVGSTGFSSGISFSLGGNIGFSGLSGSGGVSAGVSYSTSESQTVSECQVQNESKRFVNNEIQQNAKWKYTFSRPLLKGGPYFAACNDFYDAPLASRSLFQPVNQWAWKIPPTERDNIKGFKFKFKWMTGYSYSAAYAWWIKIESEEHHNKTMQEREFYVPLAGIYPPLIAANNLDFSKAAGHKKLELGTFRPWTAESSASWCTPSKTQGTKDDADQGVYVDVSENTTGANREAVITLKTQDGKGSSTVRVFQSRY